MKKKKIVLFYHTFGGGHRATAHALKEGILREQDCDIVLVEIFVGIPPQTCKERIFRVLYKGLLHLYNKVMQYDLGGLIRFMNLSCWRFLPHLINKHLSPFFLIVLEQEKPDMVVSTIPIFNLYMARALEELSLSVPLIITISDYADTLKLWFDPKISYENLHYLCPSALCMQQGLERGISSKTLFLLSGLLLRAPFYEEEEVAIKPPQRLGIVLFGAAGSKKMLQIAKKLKNMPENVHLLFICGHNKKLLKALQKYELPQHISCYGFVENVAQYMRKGDFFIGKPGPGSVGEALISGLPVITVSNFNTMPQEETVANYIAANKLGLVLKSYRQIDRAVTDLLLSYASYKERILQYKNRALFEAVQYILGRL